MYGQRAGVLRVWVAKTPYVILTRPDGIEVQVLEHYKTELKLQIKTDFF